MDETRRDHPDPPALPGLPDVRDVLDLLADRLSGSELTTLLLEASRRRAARVTPAEVMRRYRADRFVAAAPLPARGLRRAEDRLIAALPPSAELVALAPLVPLGTHSAVATVDPRKVVATVRGTEVAADPTNALALEAAVRRGRLLAVAPHDATRVSLAAGQRVVRAQFFGADAGLSAHFHLFGFITSGRDVGGRGFERAALTEHVRFAADALPGGAEIRVTVLDESYRGVLESVSEALTATHVTIVEDPTRTSGRGYYTGLCFKVHTEAGEVGDGGFTDWTASLLGNRKERLLISGYGVDRLVWEDEGP
jgi:hypothetical protein